ncbi:hypothetical protein AVEN_149131-1 [Araneus ventricosus]|uniref:Uncharacterized protein n=1 Tax=Araneus ventricosus TaxID=182803 RepID=A0A4Y2HBA0_ARAVE|nr:hypothetical protein AVEN_149131-1 [Araneus ventricosus]
MFKINFNPNSYEDGTTSTKFHPAIFQLENRISLKKQFLPVSGLNISTDSSKMDDKTDCVFCVKEEDTMKYEWMAQLRSLNTILQAELLAIREASKGSFGQARPTNRLRYGQTGSRTSIHFLQLAPRALLLNKHKKSY